MNKWEGFLINNTNTPLIDLLYHLPLILTLLGTSLVVSLVRKKGYPIYSKRVFIALDVLMAGQLLLIILHGLSWLNLLPVNFILPPLDRAVTVFSYIWIIWMWSAVHPGNRSNNLLTFFNISVLALLAYTLIWWNLVWQISSFNLSALDWNWQIFSLTILTAGILLTLFNRHRFWGICVLFLLINLSGHIIYLFQTNSGADYPQAVRLAQLLSFPLLIFIAARFHNKAARNPVSPPYRSPIQPQLPPFADPLAVISWINTAAVDSGVDEVYPLLAESIAHTMQADVSMIVSFFPSDQGVLHIQGHDRFHARPISPKDIDPAFLPTISAFIQRGDPLYLSSAGTLPKDAYVLSEILGFDQCGDILISPIFVLNQLWGSLIVLSPFTLRYWNPDEQSFFHATARKAGEILGRVLKPQPPAQEALAQRVNQEAQSSLDKIQVASVNQEIEDNTVSANPELVLALKEINHLKDELRQARDRLMILELDTAIEDGEIPQNHTDEWQSEIDHWINLEQSEMGSETGDVPPRRLAIDEVISQAIDEHQSEIADRKLTLQLNLPDVSLTFSENKLGVQSLLTQLVKHIINATPSNGIIRISAQRTTLADQNAAAVELGSISAENVGGREPLENTEPGYSAQSQEVEISQLEEMKSITESLNGEFFIEREPGRFTIIKVILPETSSAV